MCYLFLDSISCPYIDKDKRKEYLENLLKIFNMKPNNNDLEEELNNYQSGSYLFINWEQAQILNCIEKKEVIQVY